MNYPTQEELDQMWHKAFYGITEGRQQVEELFKMAIDWNNAQLAKQEPVARVGDLNEYTASYLLQEGHALIDALYAAPMPAQAPEGLRKVFMCRDCEFPYADAPPSQCDCFGSEIYDEGYIVMLAAAPPNCVSKSAESETQAVLSRTSETQSDDAKDAARLDFLDENLRMRMGWSVGKAPAGNISIQSIIQPSGATPIREAIDAAIVKQMSEALEIIAGKRQCIDNLLSNVDIANNALSIKP